MPGAVVVDGDEDAGFAADAVFVEAGCDGFGERAIWPLEPVLRWRW